MSRHLVHATLPGRTVKVLWIVNGPDIAVEAAEKEVAEDGASSIMDEDQRGWWPRLLAPRHELHLDRVRVAGRHDHQNRGLIG